MDGSRGGALHNVGIMSIRYTAGRPSAQWVRIGWPGDNPGHADHVSAALGVVGELPGVRLALRFIDIPQNALALESVAELFEATGMKIPAQTRRADVKRWRGKRKAFPHQDEGIAAMLEAQRGLLADDMGLGKTQQAIEWAESVRRHFDCMRPVVIVVKRPLQENWIRELLMSGAIADREEACAIESRNVDDTSFKPGRSYYLINPEIVRDWWSKIVNTRPCAVVMDEAHAYKDLRTNRGTGASMVATAPFVLLLTGSPMPNRPSELWSLLNILHPYGWGAPVDFRIRYAGAYRTEYGFKDSGATNVSELQDRMWSFYLRREVHQVGLEMPKLSRTVVTASWEEVTLGPERLREYKAQFGAVSPARLKQAIVSGHATTDVLSVLNALRKITSEAKVDATVEHVKELVEAGESVVIFVWQRAMADKLARKLRGRAVHGELAQRDRIVEVDAFQRDGGVLVATYDTLAEGVTLTRARFVVHHDLHWVPKDIAQAERRVHRIGQTRPCLAVWMTMKDSIDELFAMALETKLAAITEVLGNDDPTNLEELVSRIAARPDVQDEVQSLVDSWVGGGA